MATVCEAHRASLPCEGGTANVASALRVPDSAKPRSPAAKSNTITSETVLLRHRTDPTSAENALHKKTGQAQEEQIFDESEKGKKKRG